ncbi:MAG: hypothetical protein V1929_04280 [bacterium]
MYKQMMSVILLAGLVVVGALTADAKSSRWHKIASLSANGKDAQEVAIPADRPNISVIKFVVTEGSVIINTVVVRVGNDKDAITVGERLEKGESKEITVGDKVKATGLRISHDGRGMYDVEVK